MVCDDGKTVELLYLIKNEFGSEMKCMLVILETWYLLKDYLHIFLKKYEYVVVRQLFSKFLTTLNLDTLINSKKWWKYHNYTKWLISAVLREDMAQFLSHLGTDVSHDLFKKPEVAVDALRRDSIDQDSIKEFISYLKELRSKYEKFSSRYQIIWKIDTKRTINLLCSLTWLKISCIVCNVHCHKNRKLEFENPC